MKKLTKAFISTASLIGAGAFAGSGVAANAVTEPVPDAVYDVPAIVDADVAAGVFTTRTKPEPWQTEPTELMRVAETFTIDGNTIRATMPNGAGVAMVTDANAKPERSEAATSANSSGSCTKTITAYEPEIAGGQVRSTSAFYISSGCSGNDGAFSKAQSRDCNLGCNWHTKESVHGTAYAGSTTYKSAFACRNGSHDWRTAGTFTWSGDTLSSVRNLTGYGC